MSFFKQSPHGFKTQDVNVSQPNHPSECESTTMKSVHGNHKPTILDYEAKKHSLGP